MGENSKNWLKYVAIVVTIILTFFLVKAEMDKKALSNQNDFLKFDNKMWNKDFTELFRENRKLKEKIGKLEKLLNGTGNVEETSQNPPTTIKFIRKDYKKLKAQIQLLKKNFDKNSTEQTTIEPSAVKIQQEVPKIDKIEDFKIDAIPVEKSTNEPNIVKIPKNFTKNAEKYFEEALEMENSENFTEPEDFGADDYIEESDLEYYDIPTGTDYPRFVTNGVFPKANSQFVNLGTPKRRDDELNDVAVLIEAHSQENVRRWITSIKNQVKSRNDLPIYIFSPTIPYTTLRKWIGKRHAIAAQDKNLTEAIDKIMFMKRNFIIFVNDTDLIAPDFADFYYLGRQVLENNWKMDSFCGGANEKYQNMEMGDIFWLSRKKCAYGEMLPRRVLYDETHIRTGYSIRPEVARVGKEFVNEETKWNVDRLWVPELSRELMEQRMEYDMGSSLTMAPSDWESIGSLEKQDTYIFPYDQPKELEQYFPKEDIPDLLDYKGVIPICVKSRCAYFVPKNIRERGYQFP